MAVNALFYYIMKFISYQEKPRSTKERGFAFFIDALFLLILFWRSEMRSKRFWRFAGNYPTKSLKLVREDVRGTKVNRRRFDFPPKQFRSPHHKETSSGKSSSAWLICMSRSLLISFWRSEMRSERF